MSIVFDVIQIVLIVIGSLFLIKGSIKLFKYYNIDKVIYFLITNEFPNINEEKRKK